MLPLLVAAASQLLDAIDAPAAARRGARARGSPSPRFVLANPHALLSFDEFWSRRAQAGGGGVGLRQARPRLRLGRPLLPVGADLGLRAGCRSRRRSRARCASSPRTCAERCSWCRGRSCSSSTWERRSASSAAGCCPRSRRSRSSPGCARRARGRRARRAAAGACARCGATLVAALLAARASSTACTSTACSRATTRATWRAPGWSSTRAAAVEGRGRADRARTPGSPTRTSTTPGRRARRGLTRSGRRWIKFPTGRTTSTSRAARCRGGKGRFVSVEDYERTLRPALVGVVRARRLLLGGVGLDAVRPRARATPARCPNAIALLPRRSRATPTSCTASIPYRDGEGPVDVQLRLELQPLPAGLRAPGPDGGRSTACARRPVPRRRRLRETPGATSASVAWLQGLLRTRGVESARRSTRLTERDTRHMRRAIELAELGRGHTSPNPLVGAVVARDDEVLGRGLPRRLRRRARGGGCARPPAQIDPIGATMYVTLEPCCHQGQTPPCTDAIVSAGIKRVVVASDDPDRRRRPAAGSASCATRASTSQVVDGEVSHSARLLNQPFRKHARTGRPLRDVQVGDEPRRQGRDPDRRLEVDLRRGEPQPRAPLARRGRTPSASASAPRSPTTRC